MVSIRNGKIGMAVVCVLFCLAGITLYGLGHGIRLDNIDVKHVIPIYIDLMPIVISALGVVMVFLSAATGAAIKKELIPVLRGVSLFMIPLIAVKIWVLVELYLRRSVINDVTKTWVNDAFNDPKLRPGQFNVMEATLGCCGTVGPQVYNGNRPESCCRQRVHNMMFCTETYTRGCYQPLADYVDNFDHAMIITVWITIAIDIMVLCTGLWLVRLLKSGTIKHEALTMLPDSLGFN